FIPADSRALDGVPAPSSSESTDWYLANLAGAHGILRWRSVAPSSRANPVNTTASLARTGPVQRNGVTHFLRGQLRLRLILVKSGIQLLTLLLHLNFKQQADPPRQGLRSADEQSFGE